MRTRSTIKTINTICGKTITFLQTDGQPNKMHSAEGPALIYADQDNKAPEYYLYGIKYSKAEWKERLSQKKIQASVDISFDSQFQTIY
jgi:hypothetical protein